MAEAKLDTSQTQTAVDNEQRKSERIQYAFRLNIKGEDTSGYPFEAPAYTEVVTRDGGLMVCAESLPSLSVVKISRPNHEAEAKIVAQVGLRGEHYLYGFHFQGTDVGDFWDISFPPFVSENCSKAILQCSRCSRQELILFSEVDLIVFEQTQTVPHFCKSCARETLWQRPVLIGDVGLVIGSESYQAPTNTIQRRVRNINDRKFHRISMKNIVACIQRNEFADDVVDVLDMSRGGIRFLSLVDYQPGTPVTVAVPFMKGGANVFSPARIARVKCRPTVDIPGEFGLTYEKR